MLPSECMGLSLHCLIKHQCLPCLLGFLQYWLEGLHGVIHNIPCKHLPAFLPQCIVLSSCCSILELGLWPARSLSMRSLRQEYSEWVAIFLFSIDFPIRGWNLRPPNTMVHHFSWYAHPWTNSSGYNPVSQDPWNPSSYYSFCWSMYSSMGTELHCLIWNRHR